MHSSLLLSDHQKMRKVIITRPAAQAQEFAKKVRAIGRDAVVFPLLSISPLRDASELKATLARLDDYALVCFVSPNAIDAVVPMVPKWPRAVTIAVIGAGSRAQLATHGIHDGNATIYSPVNTLRTDSETLLEVLDLRALQGKQVLIVRGESGRELLADAFRANGTEVCQIAAYRRLAPEFDAGRGAQLTALLERDDEWIITSSEALEVVTAWSAQLPLADAVVKLQHQHLIVPHARIAETARSLGFSSITLTASGDEALLVALQSRL